MRKKLYTIILFLLILTTGIALGKDGAKNKSHKSINKKQNYKDKIIGERIKRSLHDDREPFWPNRGKKLAEAVNYITDNEVADKENGLNKNQQFWEARNRRESSSSETFNDSGYTDEYENVNKCIQCLNTIHKDLKSRRDDISPFWGNRGRRIDDSVEPLWSSLVIPEEEPFWGNRGKKEDEPFWGNRGKKEDEPFWGNRGKKKLLHFNPFRRFFPMQQSENDDPFWGNRGRREADFWDAEDWQLTPKANNIENSSRLRRSPNIFWNHRGRDSTLNTLFNTPRNRLSKPYASDVKPAEDGMVHNDRIYADQPQYILVERSSRSSSEEDPFFISRGKKYNLNYNLIKAARDRRSAIEEIVKSVRNDPYYIARGKKDDVINDNITQDAKYLKMKELICSAVDMIKDKNVKIKRETIESDRNRRTILKKLAAQLEMDPYFVSRGKKNKTNNKSYLTEFINVVADKCN